MLEMAIAAKPTITIRMVSTNALVALSALGRLVALSTLGRLVALIGVVEINELFIIVFQITYGFVCR